MMPIASTPGIDCQTSIVLDQGRLIVCCDVSRLISSGLAVDDLFVIIRPKIEEAVRDAATRDADFDAPHRPIRVLMDVGGIDPDISIRVGSPAARLEKLAEHLDWVQSTVARFVAGHYRGSL